MFRCQSNGDGVWNSTFAVIPGLHITVLLDHDRGFPRPLRGSGNSRQSVFNNGAERSRESHTNLTTSQ